MKSPCFPVDVKQAETREVATKVLLLGVNNFAVKHGLWLDRRGHQSPVESPELVASRSTRDGAKRDWLTNVTVKADR